MKADGNAVVIMDKDYDEQMEKKILSEDGLPVLTKIKILLFYLVHKIK